MSYKTIGGSKGVGGARNDPPPVQFLLFDAVFAKSFAK